MKHKHFYKGYELRNVKKARGTPAHFHILSEAGAGPPINSTTSMRGAKTLIDLWTESRYCGCGILRGPHSHLCVNCERRYHEANGKHYAHS